MKKIYLFIILALAFIFLCGCGRFDITCSLDDDNNAKMKIELTILKDELSVDESSSLEVSFGELLTYWQDEGFDVDWNYAGGSYKATLTKRAKGENREDALNELLYMMGGDISPFSYAEGGYSESYFSDMYNIKAEIDLANIVDYEYINTLPESQRTKIMDAISAFHGTVTFNLAGETVEYKGNLSGGKNTVSLSLDEPAQISSVMEVKNTGNKLNYDSLIDEMARLEKEKRLYTLLVIISASILLMILVLTTVLLVKHKKNNGEK